MELYSIGYQKYFNAGKGPAEMCLTARGVMEILVKHESFTVLDEGHKEGHKMVRVRFDGIDGATFFTLALDPNNVAYYVRSYK